MAIKKIQRNTFGVSQQNFDVPDINQIQISSYYHFWEKQLPKILEEFSPITDNNGNRWKITLGPDYSLEPIDDVDEFTCITKGTTYSSNLYINVLVENLITKEKKSQKVFAAKVPTMTKKGNFIINGVQKIVVSQLVKSPGLIYTKSVIKGKEVYSSRIIPSRGIWLDLEIDNNGVIYTRIDRKKKFPVTQLLRLFGIISDNEINDLFKDVDTDDNISYIQNTLSKDTAYSIEEAINSIYKKLRPGDIVPVEQGKKFLRSLFEDESKYDFGEVGRYKFDQRLDIKSKPEKGNSYKHTLSIEEIISAVRELIRMTVDSSEIDNIDSLSNRRVRTVGEWIGNTFKTGLSRVVRNSRDKMTMNEDQNFTPAQLVNMRPLAAMVEDFFNTSQLSRFMDQTNLLSEMDQRQFMTCAGPGGLTRERAGFEVRDVQPSFYGRICPVNTPEGPAFGINLHTAIYAKINRLGFLETPYYKIKSSYPVEDDALLHRVLNQDITIDNKVKYKDGISITAEVLKDLRSNLKAETEIQVNPHVSKEFEWLSSEQESRYTIAEYVKKKDEMGHIHVDVIGARKKGEPVQVKASEAEYMDVSSHQIFSLSSLMVPFVAQTEGMRALGGTNQQGQALPLVRPDNPYVATGFEKIAAKYSGYMFTSEVNGIVKESDGNRVVVQASKTGEQIEYNTLKFLPSNNHSTINQKVVVKPGEKVSKGDVLVEGFGVHNGEFAIGQNVRVAFMPFKGYNYEDAIVLSERLVQKDKFTSTHIHQLVCDVHETRLGVEEITTDIPNLAVDKLKKLDNEGIIHLGAYVESGDILVGKITPKGEIDLTPEDKLIRVLFGEYSKDVRDSSLYLQHGLEGKVINIQIFSRENGDPLPNDVVQRVRIWLATTRKIKPGDKMSGRHGNKGVVSIVLPVEDMPYTADGRPVDMILNPLSVISRMNLGQILETHLGLVCEKNETLAVTQPLNEISIQTIQEELRQIGEREDGKATLYDGQSGEAYDRPVVVGNLYFNKLHHMVDDKIHTRSTGPYSLVTQQPLGGRSHSGGQRFGEMEVWALEAYGAAYSLQEMLTIKSDDVKGRESAFESIVKEKPIISPNLPSSFIVLANELTALGIKVNAKVTAFDDGHSAHLDTDLALSVDEK